MVTRSDSSPKLIYQTRQGSAQYFDQPLGNELSLRMMLIPSGNFMMGSPMDEPKRRHNEGPQRRVQVDAFCMGKYPVTQAQWRVVVAMPQVNQPLKLDPSWFKGENRPVEQVSWHDAVEFCARLSACTGYTYRLPSEAEWEYACRAGTTTPFHFGETITTEVANYDGDFTYNRGRKGEPRKETTPIEHFDTANAFGLCDMHGNVWEWCKDHRHGNYEGAPTDGSAWLSDDKDAGRVIRGGSWYSYPENCRSATRNPDVPRETGSGIGFRVVCSTPSSLL